MSAIGRIVQLYIVDWAEWVAGSDTCVDAQRQYHGFIRRGNAGNAQKPSLAVVAW